jgi:hypothetical protein
LAVIRPRLVWCASLTVPEDLTGISLQQTAAAAQHIVLRHLLKPAARSIAFLGNPSFDQVETKEVQSGKRSPHRPFAAECKQYKRIEVAFWT